MTLAEVDDYLVKPVEITALLAAIEARLRRRTRATAPDFSSAAPLEKLALTPRGAEVLLWIA